MQKIAVQKRPVKVQFENSRVMLTPAQAKKVKILRVGDGQGFYQRPLDQIRVDDICKDLKKTGFSNYPEITIANVGGVLQCVDGQTRMMGHIQADINVAAHIMSLTQQQAIDIYCRDNGKARRLGMIDLVSASRCPVAQTIRGLVKDYKASTSQIANLMMGICGRSSLGSLHDQSNIFTEPEIRAATIVLDVWTQDKRFVYRQRGCSTEERKFFKKYKDTPEAAYSSPLTMHCLGRLAKENLSNINKIKQDMSIVQKGDWTKKTGQSLRTLQSFGNSNRKNLLMFMKANVLNPAYRK